MNIPAEIKKCVVFLGYKDHAGIYHLRATGFFLGRVVESVTSFGYVVTAKHVIDRIRDMGMDRVCLRVNLKNAEAKWYETNIADWKFHPDDTQTVDVAVFCLGSSGFLNEWDHAVLTPPTFVTSERLNDPQRGIGVGNEIFLAGLFANHHGERRNIPIVRVGNIIAMPEPYELVETEYGLMEAYLVEARSLGGISGSPVFVRLQQFGTNQMIQAFEGAVIALHDSYFLLGLMHGHWDLTAGSDVDNKDDDTADTIGRSNVNMGIAIVVPITKIWEVVEQPVIKKTEKEAEHQARKKNLPTEDFLDDAPSQGELTHASFDDVLRRVSRKITDSSEPEPEKKD